LVKSPPVYSTNHPAEDGIEFNVIVAAQTYPGAGILRPFSPMRGNHVPAQKGLKTSKNTISSNLLFWISGVPGYFWVCHEKILKLPEKPGISRK
jgi:hypothetical protein